MNVKFAFLNGMIIKGGEIIKMIMYILYWGLAAAL